jgi:molybdenum cofactor cytidylyltransferase
MGRCKPLMEWDGKTWLAHALDRFHDAGCDEVVGVVSKAAPAREASARFVQVDQIHLGMLHSVQCATAVLPGRAALMVCPCDMPALSTQTVRTVRSAIADDRIVVPTWNGRRGHPIAIGCDLVKKVMQMDARHHGLDRLLKTEALRVRTVPVDDPACVVDFDTPEDWLRFCETLKEGKRDG